MSTSNEKAMRLALEALKTLVDRFDYEQFTSVCELDDAKDAIKALEAALEAHKALGNEDADAEIIKYHEATIARLQEALAQSRSDVKQEQRSVSEHTGEPACCNGNCPNTKECEQAMQCLYTTPYVPEGRQQRKPLTDEQIFAIGKELGLKCRLGGNPNIDIDYAKAIEAAHGIKE